MPKIGKIIQTVSFLMAIILLHEFVHYGNLLTGYNTNGKETGNLFETALYQVLITKDTAGKFYTEFK